jgi:DUF2934 family protein
MLVGASAPLPTKEKPIRDEEKIRLRAYELYEQRGKGDGRALDDWLQAEVEIRGTRGQLKNVRHKKPKQGGQLDVAELFGRAARLGGQTPDERRLYTGRAYKLMWQERGLLDSRCPRSPARIQAPPPRDRVRGMDCKTNVHHLSQDSARAALRGHARTATLAVFLVMCPQE